MPHLLRMARAYDAAELFADEKVSDLARYAREHGLKRWWEERADVAQVRAKLLRALLDDDAKQLLDTINSEEYVDGKR